MEQTRAASHNNGGQAEPANDKALIERAWGIIANAGGGSTHDGTIGWHNESPEWQEAAELWRDDYHSYLSDITAGDES